MKYKQYIPDKKGTCRSYFYFLISQACLPKNTNMFIKANSFNLIDERNVLLSNIKTLATKMWSTK